MTTPAPPPVAPLNPDDLLLLGCAHRYALGRQTYMVGVCIDRLQAHWPEFPRPDRRTIVAETLEALLDGRAGDPRIDAPAWREFARWAWDQMEETQRMRVRDRLAWKLGVRMVEALMTEPESESPPVERGVWDESQVIDTPEEGLPVLVTYRRPGFSGPRHAVASWLGDDWLTEDAGLVNDGVVVTRWRHLPTSLGED